MRILFFTNEYSHPRLPNSGGVGSFLKIMSESLTDKGHEVFVYGFSKKPLEFSDNGIHFKFFKKYSKQFRFKEFKRSISTKLGLGKADIKFLEGERKYYAKKLKSYSQKHQIDIIESFVFNGFTAYFDNSTPLVLRFHGSRGFWHRYLDKAPEKAKIEIEKKALNATPFVIANSNFSKDFIEDYYNVDVDTVIHNGIDTKLFAPDNTIKELPKSIFYVGTMSEAKGVKDLANIFNSIIEAQPEASLHLIGRGESYWNYINTEVLSEKAQDKTQYYNHYQLSEIPKKLMEASVIVVPSKGETFGFTIVEAMALEKVTVVSNIPVAKEIISDGVDGFIAKDSEDFIKIILKILDDSNDYDALKKRAREKVLHNFTLEKMITDSINYYKKIIENNSQSLD
ncbi:glycosyltransferase family 4 protein [Winogradskyella ouciana]|uniref:Glycosyltransferase n=1 Tax=Winogradskyella ouciana TaxID=2608631 RepID=A0A7K1GEU9_9FLAO|nr:glycosyltransferase family 4 protein [Winogradskyella ouciana]MTE27621.1 glycosyltransferase [Winogradskyella ouciana]